MGTEQQIIDRDVELAELALQVEAMDKVFQESERLRKRHFYISTVSLLLMLLILLAALGGMITYFQSYPKGDLIREIIHKTRHVFFQQWMPNSGIPADREIMKIYSMEYRKALRDWMPSLKRELRTEIRACRQFSENELKQHFQQRLTRLLNLEMRLYLARKKAVPAPENLIRLQQMNQTLAAEMTNAYFQLLYQPGEHNDALSGEMRRLSQTPMYRSLQSEPLQFIENRFFADLLDETIILLNESRGGEHHE